MEDTMERYTIKAVTIGSLITEDSRKALGRPLPLMRKKEAQR